MQSFMNDLMQLPGRMKSNWKSGLTVALISVPLSVALSIASGAGPIPGLITGVWATLIASLFASSNYNIIGPAGALATVLFGLQAVTEFGPAILPILAIATGVLLLLMWALNAAKYLYYIPTSIVHGFSAGVAVSIAAQQLYDGTGLRDVASGSLVKRPGEFLEAMHVFGEHASGISFTAVAVTVAFFAFILVWKKKVKSIPAVIPTAVLGVIFGAIVSYGFFLNTTALPLLGTKYEVVNTVTASSALFAPVDWSKLALVLAPGTAAFAFFWKTAILVAVIAVLETLITAKIGDKITRTQHSSRKELFGLGLANLGSGFMGGLPATGVFLRTGANIKAGATHRASATVSALVTGIVAAICLPFFAYIPMAVIAAMLINTALGLIETKAFAEYWHHDKASFVIAMLTGVITLLIDPGIAVLVGAIIALVLFVDRVSRGATLVVFNMKGGDVVREETRHGVRIPEGEVAVAVYSLAGAASYIDAGRHASNIRTLMRSPRVKSVVIRMRDCYTVDFDTIEMLSEAVLEAEASGTKLAFASLRPEIADELSKFPALRALVHDASHHTTTEALNALSHKTVVS
jgi:SulP family sulfate permease